jgi:flagellar protein FliL
MATKETPPPPPAADAPPPKKGKKLLIIAIAAVVLVIGIGSAAWVLLKPAPADDEDAAAVDEPKKGKKKKEEKPLGPPAYLKMDAFTVNLQGESGDQFLRIELSARFEDAGESERAKQYMPSIRNKVLLLLSGKKAAELAPKEGKEKLAQEILTEMNAILAHDDGKKEGGGLVKEVLFTEFVVQ